MIFNPPRGGNEEDVEVYRKIILKGLEWKEGKA